MKSVVCALADLGADLVLAPERHLVAAASSEGVPLSTLVLERRERIDPSQGREGPIVLDTSHARDGVLDVAGALRDGAGTKSAKKRALVGDVVVSRLRPYLRQVALVHEGALAASRSPRELALSTEFYVLAPRTPGDDLAFLVPFLLAPATQAALAAAQEGGHHPRVPRESLFSLRVPTAVLRARGKTSARVREALAAIYEGASALHAAAVGEPDRRRRSTRKA
ncbi:MAG: hypothetical protein JST00_09040 [Deltaproteobacteria bacterium]|nr:hypothetical protein [Deltaproteobacteria bacterium]